MPAFKIITLAELTKEPQAGGQYVLRIGGASDVVIGDLEAVRALRAACDAVLPKPVMPAPPGGDGWLTISQAIALAADKLHKQIPRPTLVRACQAGRINGAAKRGKDWVMPLTEFSAWLQIPSPRGRRRGAWGEVAAKKPRRK